MKFIPIIVSDILDFFNDNLFFFTSPSIRLGNLVSNYLRHYISNKFCNGFSTQL